MAAHLPSPRVLSLLGFGAVTVITALVGFVLLKAVEETPPPKEPGEVAVAPQTPVLEAPAPQESGGPAAPAEGVTSPRVEEVRRQTAIPGTEDVLREHDAGSSEEDASVRLTPQFVPKNALLEAYSAEKPAKTQANGVRAPALRDRERSAPSAARSSYTLADAIRDAKWRKRTSEKLAKLFRRADASGEF